MVSSNLYFRVVLTVLLVHFALSTFANDFPAEDSDIDNKNQINGKIRKIKRQATLNSSAGSGTLLESCFPPIKCVKNSRYRTLNGTCNNLEHPYWGSANISAVRMFPHHYEDGKSTPRGTNRNPPLPRPRDVSVAMVNTITPPSNDKKTSMFILWGQFIDHDILFTPTVGVPAQKCCDDLTFRLQTPECFVLNVTGDDFYSKFNISCLKFVRSLNSSCAVDLREQVNERTAYIDVSHVYGISEAVMTDLREPNSWKLKSGPGSEDCGSSCLFSFLPVRRKADGSEEFFSGDIVEQQPGLTSLHTLFLRLHNYIGQIIRDNNKNTTIYNDEKVFQETRKIAGGLFQQISYGEFLPALFGLKLMKKYQLELKDINSVDPYIDGYNKNLDSSVPIEISTAAYRFGHSQVTDTITLPGGVVVDLSKSFFNHNRTTIPGSYPSQFLSGLCSDITEDLDQRLVEALHNKLFANPPYSYGQDLYSRNIQRGRDHGLPPYITVLNMCRGLEGAISYFDDLIQVMPQEVVNTLKKLYGNRLQDIDLFPAGIAENNTPGSVLGPTFACLNGLFFKNLKYGDRFWFENPKVFKKRQLKAIRKTKFSSLLCKFAQITQVQEFVMLPISTRNPLKNCTELLQEGIIHEIGREW